MQFFLKKNRELHPDILLILGNQGCLGSVLKKEKKGGGAQGVRCNRETLYRTV